MNSSTGLTYESYYGLKVAPFRLAADPAFFYASQAHTGAFNRLLSAIQRRERLCVVSGDIGLGKTTLCRTVLEHLDRRIFSAFVPDPFVSREDLLKIVLIDFGVASTEDLTSGRLKGASRTELSYLLYEFLDTLAPFHAFAVLFVDEAQHLSSSLIDEIRILADSDGRKNHLQVVLVGQPELQQRLLLPELRQVNQRVSVHCTLRPLDRDGMAGYITHRLHVAGGTDRVTFSRTAYDAVYEASAGVPRLINRICDRVLQEAAMRGLGIVSAEVVRAVSDETRSGEPAVPTPAPVVTATPSATPEESAEANDQWFAIVDQSVQATTLANTSDGESSDVLSFPVFPPSGRREHNAAMTRMERLAKRWMRNVRVAMLLLVLFAGAGIGMSLAWVILQPALTTASGR